ncbi:MAG: HEPN domain-containing protein [Phycisphaerales bacterium]
MSEIEETQYRIKEAYQYISEPALPLPREMQAIDWWYIAVEYLMGASILDKKEPHFTGPRLQLTGHAIECSMKACFASVGANPPNTHDLVRLYTLVDKHGFHLENRLQAMLVHLNCHYYQDLGTGSKYKLRYPTETSERSGGAIPNHSDMRGCPMGS